jgi:hypothetical protein
MADNAIITVSEEQYLADPCSVPSLSASIAKILINQSPLHAWTAHPRLNPNYVREEKEIFDLGTVAHALMLQGIDVALVFDVDDWRNKEARLARAEARKEGRIPILRKQWARVQEMVQAGKRQIAAHREASDIFTDAGKAEQTITWVDDHGVVCRARLDWLRNDYGRIADYKGTGMSVNPEQVARIALSAGWDIQAAFYLRGMSKIDPTVRTRDFLFGVQEDKPPYAMTIAGMGPDFLWAGQSKVQRAIDIWASCTESNRWPAYPDRIVYPQLPQWAEAQIEQADLRSIEA